MLVQGWSCFSPSFSAVDFVSYYIELPIFVVMIIGWKLIKRMDLVTDVYTIEDIEPKKEGWKAKGGKLGTWLCF